MKSLLLLIGMLICLPSCEDNCPAQGLPKMATYEVTITTDNEETDGITFTTEIGWLTNPGSQLAHDRAYANLVWFKNWLVVQNDKGGYDYIPIASIKRIRIKQAFDAYPRLPIPGLRRPTIPDAPAPSLDFLKGGEKTSIDGQWGVPIGPIVRLDRHND